jgi:hypothetical protein
MTVSQPPILAAEERAWNYWFVDGLTNLVVGVSALLMAFCLFYPPHWPARPLPVALWATALVSYAVIGFRHRQIVEWLKAKTTYPRSGYVQSPYPDDPAEAANLVTFWLRGTGPATEVQTLRIQRRTTALLATALVVMACFGFLVIHTRWIWSVVGIVFSAAMVIARKDQRLSWILPVGFPLLGLYLTTFVPRPQAPALFMAGMGILFLLDGALKLIRYVLQNPAPKVPAA